MTPHLLLVHGWGFDAGFWEPMRAALGGIPSTAWDLGFRGRPDRPALPKDTPVVAVGHSFGLLWLLKERPVTWTRLVSINGFSRFVKADGLPDGVAPRLVERMIAKLADDPRAVYFGFMARCGLSEPPGGGFDVEKLAWGLNALAEWDCRAAAAVDLALAGRSDPILPKDLTDALFPPSLARWHDGGHLLPLADPEWCARRLKRVVESVA